MPDPVIGIAIHLPSGDDAVLLFKTDHDVARAGRLMLATVAQRACDNAGFYDRPIDYPIGEDVETLLAGAHAFVSALRGEKPKCPKGCSWIAPGRPAIGR